MTSTISAANGNVPGWLDKYLIAEIDINNSDKIKQLHKDIKESYSMLNSIGVGETVEEAILAAKQAEKDYSIRVYSPDMHEAQAEASKDVAISEEDRPMTKSEAPKKAIDEDTKQQLAMILKALSENKPYLEQVKQAKPDVYQTIVDLVSSLGAIADEAKKQTADDKLDQAKKLIDFVKEIHEGELDENEKQLIEHLMSEQASKKEDKKYADIDRRKAERKYHQRKVQDVTPTAKKHGLDPEFLAHILKGG